MRRLSASELKARATPLRQFVERWGVILAACAALALALATNLDAISTNKAYIDEKLAEKGDVRNLYFAAANASWSDAPRWFFGPWNSPGIGYYRPLTSVIFLAEQRAFGRNFAAWNTVSWLVHGFNAVLLFLLAALLLRRYPIGRIVFGFVAVWYFATPACSLEYAVHDIIAWWPAQNDSFGLLFGLLALILIVQYAGQPKKRAWLIGSYIAFAASVGFKEQGYVIAPMAICFLLFLDRRLWRAMLGFVILAGFMWVYRLLVVPHPWGLGYASFAFRDRALFRAAGPVYLDVTAGTWWTITAAVGILATIAIGLRRRWSIYAMAGTMLAVEIGCSGIFLGMAGLAIPFETAFQLSVLNLLAYLGALIVFWKYRRTEPGIPAAIAFGFAFLPSLQYVGRHYFYWPAAFLGLADGIFCACLWRWALEVAPGLNPGRLAGLFNGGKVKSTVREIAIDN